MNISNNILKKVGLIPAVYLHIPFCKKICPFCSFAVRRDRANLHGKYLQAVIDEISRRAEMLKENEANENGKIISESTPLKSIYFGGGTPSRLTLKEVSALLDQLQEYFPWTAQTEISFEMNPEDVNSDYLSGLFELGVNRLSIGGQSFQSSILQQLDRCHNSADLRQAVKTVNNSPFSNWNLDLMFGVPEQSVASFKNDVEEALAGDPSHLSLYGLEIHEQTSFGKNKLIRKWETEHQEQFERMYLWAVERLEKAGLFQYEVSNFSKNTKEGRNNLLVWSGQNYFGFGVGAHSYFQQTRWGNVRSLRKYHQLLGDKNWPIEFEEKLTKKELASESLMLGLRSSEGINIEHWLDSYELCWSKEQVAFVQGLCDEARAFWKADYLCLTPKGLLLADRITVQLMPGN